MVHLRIASTGSTAEGAALLAPMLTAAPVMINMVGPMPYTSIGQVHMDPADPAPSFDAGCLLGEFPGQGRRPAALRRRPGVETPLLVAEIRHLGGAMAVEPAVPNAVSGRDATWSLFTLGMLVPPVADLVPAAARGVVDALRPLALGGAVQLRRRCGPARRVAGRRPGAAAAGHPRPRPARPVPRPPSRSRREPRGQPVTRRAPT